MKPSERCERFLVFRQRCMWRLSKTISVFALIVSSSIVAAPRMQPTTSDMLPIFLKYFFQLAFLQKTYQRMAI